MIISLQKLIFQASVLSRMYLDITGFFLFFISFYFFLGMCSIVTTLPFHVRVWDYYWSMGLRKIERCRKL